MSLRQGWARGPTMRVATAIAMIFVTAGLRAAPFLPADDAQVLERLPGRNTAQFRELKALQVAAAQAPNDLARATAVATAYIRVSRLEGDPRFLGYAQAALAPWWKDPAAPTAVLILRATILQSSHQFDSAIAKSRDVTPHWKSWVIRCASNICDRPTEPSSTASRSKG